MNCIRVTLTVQSSSYFALLRMIVLFIVESDGDPSTAGSGGAVDILSGD